MGQYADLVFGAAGRGVVVEQFGDAEVEQFHLAGVGDEDVRRLQVPVQDQPRMGMRHCRQHVEEEPDQRGRARRAVDAVAVDRFAVDVFQHQVGLAGLGADAGIEQACDVRVVEPREDAALALETRHAAAAEQPGLQELDCHLAFVAPIGAPRQPDAAHAAVAQFTLQRVGADGLAAEAGRSGHRGRGQKGLAVELLHAHEHRGQVLCQHRVFGPQGVEAGLLLGGRQVEQLVEPGRDLRPARGIDGRDLVHFRWVDR